MKALKFVRYFGLLLVLAGLTGVVPMAYYWQHSRAAVAAAPATITLGPSGTTTPPIPQPDPSIISGHPVAISIPSLNINLQVIDGFYNPKNGEWTLTNDKAQFATPSVEPNDHSGNTLIYGHYRKEVFAYLHLIKPGAYVTVTTSNGYIFTYQYTNTQTFDPTDTSIFSYQGAPRLTIQTCSGAFFQHRQMYYFQFISAQKA